MVRVIPSIYFPYYLYRRFIPSIRRILSTHVCLHFRIVRLHLCFYFSNLSRPRNKMGHIPFLWLRTYYALKKAVIRGDILEYPSDTEWLYLPNTGPSLLDSKYRSHSHTYRIWVSHSRDIGDYTHALISRMLRETDFRLPKTTPSFYLDSGEQISPDAYTLTPIHAAFEVKDGLSEIWSDPRGIHPRRMQRTEYPQIINHFEMCRQNNLIPAFIGVKFDPSFYDFVSDNNGVCFELGFQIFSPSIAHIIPVIASDLGFTNIVSIPEDPPYPAECSNLFHWFDSIKILPNP